MRPWASSLVVQSVRPGSLWALCSESDTCIRMVPWHLLREPGWSSERHRVSAVVEGQTMSRGRLLMEMDKSDCKSRHFHTRCCSPALQLIILPPRSLLPPPPPPPPPLPPITAGLSQSEACHAALQPTRVPIHHSAVSNGNHDQQLQSGMAWLKGAR